MQKRGLAVTKFSIARAGLVPTSYITCSTQSQKEFNKESHTSASLLNDNKINKAMLFGCS